MHDLACGGNNLGCVSMQDVYLRKACPDHGAWSTVIWRGAPSYRDWVRPKLPTAPTHPSTAVDRGCPFDCGLCPDHRQTTCCALLEVTRRCDLRCAVCFADAGHGRTRDASQDPPLEAIERWYRSLLDAGGPVNVQLSGGEPTLRDDLPEIIRLGRRLGFGFFQLNTNGLRLSRDDSYLARLAEAGLSTVFLQFDSLRDDAHRRLRGRPLTARKLAAVQRCADAGIGVVLVPTVVPGVNLDDIGPLVQFALDLVPAVRGVHLQPVSYFGRYPRPPRDADRVTLPEIMRAVERGTGGRIPLSSFAPPGGENAWCSFHANVVVMSDGQLIPLSRNRAASGCCPAPTPAGEGAARSRRTVARLWSAPPATAGTAPTAAGASCCGGSAAAAGTHQQPVGLEPGPPRAGSSGQQSLGGWDVLLERARTHTFSVSAMAFQDVWNLDLERLRDCYLHEVSPDGRQIPFCAYNLTDSEGVPLYRSRAALRPRPRPGPEPRPQRST
ncbi:MAG TPA: radical SAM protein [Kineosporiaceae bacterium]|nr:radical SAM protein [Kineosporiaceae bacterium]